MSRRARRWSAILLAVVAFVLAPCRDGGAAGTESGKADLSYMIYVGGLTFGSLKARLDFAPGRYRATTDIRTEGLIQMMYGWQQMAESEGTMPGLQPSRHRSTNIRAGTTRRLDLRYAPDGVTIERAEPPIDDDERDAVPRELTRNTEDVLSAILAVGDGLAGGGSCDKRLPVFDGRRRYDVVLTQEGRESLKPSDYAPVGGDAVRCRLRYERIAGFRNRGGRAERWGEEREAVRVWFRSVGEGLPYVPVRVEFTTDLGAVMIHLTKYQEAG